MKKEQKSINPHFDTIENKALFNSINSSDGPSDVLAYTDVLHNSVDDLSIKLFSKSIAFGEPIGISNNVTSQQLEIFNSLKEYPSVDIDAELDNMMSNEFKQMITRKTLDKIVSLGQKNFNESDIKDSWHPRLCMTMEELIEAEKKNNKVNFWPNPWKWLMSIIKPKPIIIDKSLISTHIAQRKLASKLLQLGNFIAMKTRRGPGNTCITNSLLATALQDISGFVVTPQENSSRNTLGSIYLAGSIAGIQIYVDPMMRWNDTRLIVFRRGREDEAGLHLFYQNNFGKDGINKTTIVEGTSAHVAKIEAKVEIIEAGFHPEYSYIVAPIEAPDNFI